MLIGYIAFGILAGPWGFNLVGDLDLIRQVADFGIMFLLFLLGMNLEPRGLARFFRKTTIVTLLSSLVFFIAGAGISLLFGFNVTESIIIGVAMIFSSTIIGLKLLPTTTLHQQHMGEIMISILLMQDIIAIVALVCIRGWSSTEGSVWLSIGWILLALPCLTAAAFLVSRYCINYLLARFDRIQEYIFLITIGWCLFVSQVSSWLGLSYEIGAFIGGVSLAISPIARFITESLKPLRDFFLVMFFFTLGASFNLDMLNALLGTALALAIAMLLLKPLVFKFLLLREGEKPGFSLQAGVRLGQISEFSLLIAVLALESKLISELAAYLIQTATLLTFAASSYYIVVNYPTPIAVDDKLRKD